MDLGGFGRIHQLSTCAMFVCPSDVFSSPGTFLWLMAVVAFHATTEPTWLPNSVGSELQPFWAIQCGTRTPRLKNINITLRSLSPCSLSTLASLEKLRKQRKSKPYSPSFMRFHPATTRSMPGMHWAKIYAPDPCTEITHRVQIQT